MNYAVPLKNPFVQRLLREHMANINEIAEQSLLSSSFCKGAATTVQDNMSAIVCTHLDLLPYVESPQFKGKRSKRCEIMNPNSASAFPTPLPLTKSMTLINLQKPQRA